MGLIRKLFNHNLFLKFRDIGNYKFEKDYTDLLLSTYNHIENNDVDDSFDDENDDETDNLESEIDNLTKDPLIFGSLDLISNLDLKYLNNNNQVKELVNLIGSSYFKIRKIDSKIDGDIIFGDYFNILDIFEHYSNNSNNGYVLSLKKAISPLTGQAIFSIDMISANHEKCDNIETIEFYAVKHDTTIQYRPLSRIINFFKTK
jgi:hypothetical protein